MGDAEIDEVVSMVEVRTRVARPDDPFYQSDNIRRLEAASIAAWREMTDDDRKALVIVLRDSIVHLMGDPEAWLPASLIVEPNQSISVVLKFQTGKIQEAVIGMRRKAEQNMVEMRDELVDMRREMSSGDD